MTRPPPRPTLFPHPPPSRPRPPPCRPSRARKRRRSLRARRQGAPADHALAGFRTECHHCGFLSSREKGVAPRSEEHTSELQSQSNLVCRLLLEKKKRTYKDT